MKKYFMSSKLKELLKSRNLDEFKLELESKFEIKITRTTLYNYLKGKTEPLASTLYAMSKIFNVPLNYFFEEETNVQ